MKIQALILSTALVVPMTLAGQATSTSGINNATQLSNHDQQFLHKLSSEDRSEIDLAHLALKKSQNPQVQSYAKKILAADPAMEQQAKQIAQQDHSSISTSPNQKAREEYNKLSKISGKQFDQAYMQYESRKQGADLNVVKNETATANNSEVRNYAAKEETPVWKAAQAANRIAGGMSSNS